MPILTSKLRAGLRTCAVVGVSALILLTAARMVDAQGLLKGVGQGARQRNPVAGPGGGVLGGAIGGVVGVVTGVTGVFTGNSGQATSPAPAAAGKDAKGGSA